MAYITYNGKFLTRMSKWIGLENSGPVPEPIPSGAVRWKFYDANLQDWSDASSALYVLSGGHGTWAPVRDVSTGDLIPGVYDWVGTTTFSNTFPQYRLSSLSSFDILDANIGLNVNSEFWVNAFYNVGNLRSFTVKTSIGSSDYITLNHMFTDCSVTEVYLHLNSHVHPGNVNVPFNNCYRMSKLTIVFDGTTFPITVSGWLYASNLTDLTIVGTNPNTTNLIESDGWFIGDQATRGSLVNVTFAGFGSDIVTYACGGTSMFMDNALRLQSIKMYDTRGIPLERRYDNGLDLWTEVPVRLAGNQYHAFRMCTRLTDLNVDLSRVTSFEEGLAYCSGLTSDAFYMKAYKQLQRALGHAIDHSHWFVASGMSRKIAACVDIDEGGTLQYNLIAGNGSGLRFMFDDPTYVPTTDASGNGTSTNGTWTAVYRELGIWDWSGTTGAEDGSSSAFSFYKSVGFFGAYTGTLRQGVNDCVLIACGSNYAPELTAHAFQNCSGLHDIINPFNLSTSAKEAFRGCTNLTDMPIVKNSNVQDCTRTFYGDTAVQAHVKDTYDKLSATAMTYNGCFTNCGPAEERAQIPTAWGGTMS